MTETTLTTGNLREYISAQKVVTITNLMTHFNRSRATIYRTLSKIEYIASYNCNKSGITLASIPQFDSWGIWKYEGFFFSNRKKLIETIQNIVVKSPAGLYPRDVQDMLGVRIYNHLSRCVAENRIVRNNDFGHPIYFSTVNETRQSQCEERSKIAEIEMQHEKPLLSSENVIRVLVAVIKHHATTVERLMPILDVEGTPLSERSVAWVLRKYEIEKKGFP